MAENTTVKRADHLRKFDACHAMYNYFSVTIPDDMAAQADFITIVDVPVGQMVVGLTAAPSATLGASCTLQARIGTTAISAATTAAATTPVVQNAIVAPSTSEATLNFLVGGAAITEPATLTVGFFFVPAQSVTLAA